MDTYIQNIILAILLIIIGTATNVFSQEKTYTTHFLKNEKIEIDGLIDENSWEAVEWEEGFIQREPYEGKKPSQETAFKILYDDNNLYVAIRAFDTELDKIEKTHL